MSRVFNTNEAVSLITKLANLNTIIPLDSAFSSVHDEVVHHGSQPIDNQMRQDLYAVKASSVIVEKLMQLIQNDA